MKSKNILSVLSSSLVLLSCQQNEKNDNQNEQPNIIFIYADDLGWGDLSCYGSDSIYTPHIDKLAESGIRFTDFYSCASVSTPSRAGLLTGRYQIRSGMTHIEAPWVKKGLPENEITIAELLKQKGYSTALIGKWHLGHQDGHKPNDAGFDYFFGLLFSNDMMVPENPSYGHKIKPEKYLSLWRNDTRIDQQVYLPTLTQRYTAEAYQYIAKHQDKPFFLYIAHWAPHEPLKASAAFKDSSLYGLYGDVVQEMDKSVGDVMQALKDFGLLENTLVVFSSDNGARVVPQRFGNGEKCGSTGGLRGRKGTTFEGGIRVPTIAYWKNKIKPGRIIYEPAIMLDWFPTFAHISGCKIPEDREIDGKNLSELLLNNGERGGKVFYFYRKDELQAIRSGDWKYKIPDKQEKKSNHQDINTDKKPFLFNLKEDPFENNNLIDIYPELADSLKKKIENFK